VFGADGTPAAVVGVQGEPIPGYYCETCHEFSPCDEVREIAEKLGIEVDGD
jgi:hypothetical protein